MTLRHAIKAITDLILPPRCLSCGEMTEAVGGLCAPCFSDVKFITAPLCDQCGLPLEHKAIIGVENCVSCLRDAPVFGRARAVYLYEGVSRRLVLGFKHYDRTDAAQAFAAWLIRAGRELLEDADVLIPVPLHRQRLFERTYNQAALLARFVAAGSKVTCMPDALERVKKTPSQGSLSRRRRKSNVHGAFALKAGADVEGLKVLLIDDVLTTGATANACAEALFEGGAVQVDVLTIARVPAPKSKGDN